MASIAASVALLTPAARADELVAPSEPQTIVGGDTVEAGEFPEVVAIQGGPFLCSGTIVAEDVVLTAAHCFAQLAEGTPLVVLHGDDIAGSAQNPVIDHGFHPEFSATPGAQDIFDIAYVRTQQPLPGPAALPITTQSEWDDAMQYDGEVTLVGYGQSSNELTDTGIKRKVTVPITRFSPEGLEFTAGGDGRDSCNGDSGGPAFFRLANGTLRLAGITSRGSNPCGQGGIYAAPYPGLCWIRDESGLDLTNGCGGCDCLDTTPPPLPEEGCGCRTDGERSGWAATLMLVLGLGLRRRRGG